MYKPPTTYEDSIAYKEALASLMANGGYKLLSAFMDGLANDLMGQLLKCNNPDERAVLAGGLRAIHQVKSWPEIQLKAFVQALDNSKNSL